MAVEALVSVVIQKLSDFLNKESEVFEKVRDDMEKVRDEIEKVMDQELKSILNNNAQYQEQSSTVLQFQGIVYGVEDTIESFFIVETTHLKRMGFVNKCFSVIAKRCRKVPPDTMDYSQNVPSFKSKMEGFSKEIQEWRDGVRSSAQALLLQWHQPPWQERDADNYVTIFEKDFGTLLKQLIDSDGKPLQRISVFGEIGTGKAAFVNKICNKLKVKNKFTCRAVLVGETDRSVRDLILDILKQVITSCKDKAIGTHDVFLKGIEELKDESLIRRLGGFLKNKPYLIVIHDVKSLDLLEELTSALPDAKNGSVVITTSDEKAASFADATSYYHYKPLDVDDMLKVFIQKVVGSLSSEQLKHEIVEICRGNPLRITLLAGLLSKRKVTYEDWSSQHGFPYKSPSFDIVAFCYNDLPPHLKPCFLYLGLFQKGFEIPVRRLFRLWLAEGFVMPKEGDILEDTAGNYLEELVQRNMVEISKRRFDESSKKCRMIESLHHIFRPRAVEIGLFHLHQKSEKPSTRVRRLVEHTNIKYYPVSEDSNHYLQSYISLNNRKKDKGVDDEGKYLAGIIEARGFGLLKVLDLEGVDQPRLPENLGNLSHLRYLGLRWTFLNALPSSLGALIHLQTLDMKHTQITTVPSSIWNMKHLRHLCLNGARLDIPVKLMKDTAPRQLQTLQGLFVEEKILSKIDGTLSRLTNLRELDLTSESSPTSDPSSYERIGSWISSLSSLQSLKLRSTDRMGEPSKLIMKPFSSLENLSQLYLLGKLLKPLDWYKIPSGLKVLTLSVSQLEEDPMPTLSKLSDLIILRLLGTSYEGKEMCFPANGFHALQVLKLWKLEKLEILTVNEGAMQKLHTLEIRCCEKLIDKEVPNTLLKIEDLRNLILTNMPTPFVNSMKMRKKKHYKIEVIRT
ncbi:hypothetical protein L6452_13963 [Arctium lappa]|uniref:Uncharacterized protein n=1 Tax=Arctium lappa TaxID=4217 RepID=A0ACB9CJZ9_ARCLA|nr:hypothetical protein L6452_13963 [Arctium lappa]